MDTLLESNSVAAALLELQIRFSTAQNIQFFPPHITVTLCQEDGLLLSRDDRAQFLRGLCEADDLIFVLWAEGPPCHFSWLHVQCTQKPKIQMPGDYDGKWNVIYKDSLPVHADDNLMMAKRLLVNIGLVSASQSLQPANLSAYQTDGWSCGIWTVKFTEELLYRLLHAQPTSEPSMTIRGYVERTNEFIEKVLAAAVEAKRLSEVKENMGQAEETNQVPESDAVEAKADGSNQAEIQPESNAAEAKAGGGNVASGSDAEAPAAAARIEPEAEESRDDSKKDSDPKPAGSSDKVGAGPGIPISLSYTASIDTTGQSRQSEPEEQSRQSGCEDPRNEKEPNGHDGAGEKHMLSTDDFKDDRKEPNTGDFKDTIPEASTQEPPKVDTPAGLAGEDTSPSAEVLAAEEDSGSADAKDMSGSTDSGPAEVLLAEADKSATGTAGIGIGPESVDYRQPDIAVGPSPSEAIADGPSGPMASVIDATVDVGDNDTVLSSDLAAAALTEVAERQVVPTEEKATEQKEEKPNESPIEEANAEVSNLETPQKLTAPTVKIDLGKGKEGSFKSLACWMGGGKLLDKSKKVLNENQGDEGEAEKEPNTKKKARKTVPKSQGDIATPPSKSSAKRRNQKDQKEQEAPAAKKTKK